MALTVNAKTYTGDGYTANAVTYVGPAHTQTVKDDFKIARVAAKPTSVFSGVTRHSFKLTRTHTLTGALTTVGDSITEWQTSLPVGIAAADVDTICADLSTFFGTAAAKTMMKGLIVAG